VVPYLERLLEVKKGDAWDFVEDEPAPANRTAREYLFHTPSHSPTRCYDASLWTKRVKLAFQQFSPSGTPTPPRLLRQSFVTELRSDPECPRDLLESAAIAMKHSLDTQKNTYDLEANIRLTAKAFTWAENYAARFDAAATNTEEMLEDEQETGMDVDGGYGSPNCEPVEGRSPGGIGESIGSSGPQAEPSASVPPVQTTAKVRRAPPKSVAQQQKRPKTSRAAAKSGSSSAAATAVQASSKTAEGNQYTIDRAIGGSRADASSPIKYRWTWQGFTDITWQESPLPVVEIEEDYMGFCVKVLPMGSAAELLAVGRKPSLKPVALVLGGMVEGSETTRYCYTTTGQPHRLDLTACTLDGEPKDWLLSTDRKVMLTDHVLDWESDDRLAAARVHWDGSQFPSLEHMSVVLRELATVTREQPHCPEQVKREMLEIELFLAQPSTDSLPIVTGRAHNVRARFLDGGLIRDCLSLLGSLNVKAIKTLVSAV